MDTHQIEKRKEKEKRENDKKVSFSYMNLDI